MVSSLSLSTSTSSPCATRTRRAPSGPLRPHRATTTTLMRSTLLFSLVDIMVSGLPPLRRQNSETHCSKAAGYYNAYGNGKSLTPPARQNSETHRPKAARKGNHDYVIHLGDYIYEGAGGGERAHDPPHEILTLHDYRTRHSQACFEPTQQSKILSLTSLAVSI